MSNDDSFGRHAKQWIHRVGLWRSLFMLVGGVVGAYIAVSIAMGSISNKVSSYGDRLDVHDQRLSDITETLATVAADAKAAARDRLRIERENVGLMTATGDMRREVARLNGAVTTLNGVLQMLIERME